MRDLPKDYVGWCGKKCYKCKYDDDECRVGYEHACIDGLINEDGNLEESRE